jgi:hypothetical protein
MPANQFGELCGSPVSGWDVVGPRWRDRRSDAARLVQYGILGAFLGTGIQLIAIHNIAESVLRPGRVALSTDASIGDSLPRSRPTFATRSNLSVVAFAFSFSVIGAYFGAVIDEARSAPATAVVIWCQLTKSIGGTILLTQQTVAALADRPAGLVDRAAHPLKGKAASVQIFGLDDAAIRADDR